MKHLLRTSWPISLFWVFLSVALALLSTYSFLQADWVIKRNLIITNYYEPLNETVTVHETEPRVRQRPFILHGKQQQIYPTQTQQSHFLDFFKEDNRKSHVRTQNRRNVEGKQNRHQRVSNKVVKVTKVVTSVRFGTIGVCTTLNTLVQCQLYEEKNQLSVSSLWGIVAVVGGSGCITLCVSAVLSLMAIALPSSFLRHQVATVIGHTQTIAVVLLFLSLLLFPLGFDSDFVRHHCGPLAAPYNIADCEVGWAYALVLVCASLALYCPVLVKFTADIRYDSLPKYL